MATYYWRGGATATYLGTPAPWPRGHQPLPPIGTGSGCRGDIAGFTYAYFIGHDVNDRNNWTLVPRWGGGFTYTGYPPAPNAPPPGSDIVFTNLFNYGTEWSDGLSIPNYCPVGTIKVPGGSTAAKLNSVTIEGTLSYTVGIWREGISFQTPTGGSTFGCEDYATGRWGLAQWSAGRGACAFSFYAKNLYINGAASEPRQNYLYLIKGTDVGATQDCSITVTSSGLDPLYVGGQEVHLSGYIKNITNALHANAHHMIILHGRDTELGLTGAHISDEKAITTTSTSGTKFWIHPGVSFSHPRAKINLNGAATALYASTGLNIPNTTINLIAYDDFYGTPFNSIWVYGGIYNKYLNDNYINGSNLYHRDKVHLDYILGCTLPVGQCPPVTFGTINIADYNYRNPEYPRMGISGSCTVNLLKIENGRVTVDNNPAEIAIINGGYLNPLRSSIVANSSCLQINDDRTVEGGFVIKNTGTDSQNNIPIYVKGNENLRYDITDPGYSYGEIIFNF